MSIRRTVVVVVTVGLLAALCFGAGWAQRGGGWPWEAAAADTAPGETPAPTASADEEVPPSGSTPTPVPEPEAPPKDPGATPTPVPEPEEVPSPAPTPVPEPEAPEAPEATPHEVPEPTPPPAGPRLWGKGDSGAEVRDLQARLKQIDWFDHGVTGYYGDVTAAAVEGFQAKRGIAVTGEVDRRTLDLLHGMTREPTPAELADEPATGGNTAGAADPRCLTGRVLCVDKSSRTLRWMVDGQVRRTVDVRFGSDELPTREGAFSVYRKSRDHVSSLYDTPMPYAMFFSGGQAVHYSPDFAAHGYAGASHGCVNVRDEGAIAAIYGEVRIGDKVIVYWS